MRSISVILAVVLMGTALVLALFPLKELPLLKEQSREDPCQRIYLLFMCVLGWVAMVMMPVVPLVGFGVIDAKVFLRWIPIIVWLVIVTLTFFAGVKWILPLWERRDARHASAK